MKIWISGCAGFLGQRLARRFSALGHKVTGFSRRKPEQVDQAVEIDLADDDAGIKLRTVCEESGAPDVFIHAASQQPSGAPLSGFVRSNVVTTANLWDALKDNPPRQFIFTSTLSVYGNGLDASEAEPAPGILPYSATKRWAEQICQLFSSHSQVTIFRLPSLYGAGQADSFIDGLARHAIQGEPIELLARGQLVRDALHVDDVVNAIVASIDRPPPETPCVMNLGVGEAIRAIDYVKALIDALGSSSQLVLVDKPTAHGDMYANIEKARRLIGFSPTPLPESMKRYADELRT